MGMHRDLRIKRGHLYTIHDEEFNKIANNSTIIKVVPYIEDNIYCERGYVLMKPLFQYLRVIFLEDIIQAGIENLYYYYRTEKLYIQNYSSELENEYVLPISIISPNM